MKRNQFTAGLLATLLFLCGAAVGALGHRYYTSSIVMAKPSEDARQRYVSEMRSNLRLTDDQVNKLQAILDETKARTRAVRDQYHPAMVQIKQEQVQRVKSILTPEQIPAYENLVADRERRLREAEERDRQADQRRAAAREHNIKR